MLGGLTDYLCNGMVQDYTQLWRLSRFTPLGTSHWIPADSARAAAQKYIRDFHRAEVGWKTIIGDVIATVERGGDRAQAFLICADDPGKVALHEVDTARVILATAEDGW